MGSLHPPLTREGAAGSFRRPRRPRHDGGCAQARALALAHDAGDADQQEGGDDRDDETEHVQLPDVAGAHQAGDDATDERADDTERERAEQAQGLLAGLEQARERTDDQADDQ